MTELGYSISGAPTGVSFNGITREVTIGDTAVAGTSTLTYRAVKNGVTLTQTFTMRLRADTGTGGSGGDVVPLGGLIKCFPDPTLRSPQGMKYKVFINGKLIGIGSDKRR